MPTTADLALADDCMRRAHKLDADILRCDELITTLTCERTRHTNTRLQYINQANQLRGCHGSCV